MASKQELRGALEAIDRILNRGGDADDVLRAVLAVLHRLFGYVAIAFVEEEELVIGPALGTPPGDAEAFPVSFKGAKVAELCVATAASGSEDRAFLERAAILISPYCLVGWDTGGVPWSEVS